jgi:hypothetical protein
MEYTRLHHDRFRPVAPLAWLAIGAVLGVAPAAAQHSGTALLSTDFESRDQALTRKLAGHRHLAIAPDAGVNGSAALKATYVGYPRGSKRIVMSHRLPEAVDQATLQYDVKFAHDFQFVRGGKLHGLGPKRRITGGRAMQPDGWSARVMFRDNRQLASYIYCQNKDGKWGEGIASGDRFRAEKGRYYAVSLHVKLNDPPNQANGLAEIYINGRRIVRHTDIQYRGKGGPETRIQKLLFSTFHGGHEPDWAPKNEAGEYVDVHAWFDNFAVYPGEQIREKPGPPSDGPDDAEDNAKPTG